MCIRDSISLVSTDLTGTNALGFGGDYETWDYPTSTMLYVGFNCNAGACRDPAVRQALSRGLDRNSVASALYARHAVASALPVHPAAACYDETAAAALDFAPQAPVSYTHLDVYKRQICTWGSVSLG